MSALTTLLCSGFMVARFHRPARGSKGLLTFAKVELLLASPTDEGGGVFDEDRSTGRFFGTACSE